MIDYLRNLFVSWFNKLINWFSERGKKEMTKKEPFDKNKHADDDRQKRISEGFKALDDGCKSIANLRAEIEMSQTESKTFKDNEPKVNNDLDAPVPANNNIKNNLEENNMCMGGSKLKKEEPKLKVNRVGSMTVCPKIFDSSISSIKSFKYSNDESHINPNDINGSFEYQDEKVQKAMKGENNKMGELINKKAEEIKQDVKQEIKKEMDDKFAESTNKINQLKEDMKEVKKDIKDIKDEQIDLKKMIARSDEQIADNKIRIKEAEKMLEEMKQQTADIHKQTEEIKEMRKNQEKKYEEDKKEQDEHRKLMAKWFRQLDHLEERRKKPRSNRNDNRESTNTSFSSFHGYMNMNNSPIPRMERPDMAHSHDEN